MTHHYHPKSIVCSIGHHWCYTFHGFGQLHNKSIYFYNVVQNNSTSLKILWSLPTYLSLTLNPGNHWSFTVSTVVLVLRMSSSWNHTVRCLFSLDYSTYLYSFRFFVDFFHSLIAHLFLVLNDISFSGCITVYLSIPQIEGHFGSFQILAVMNKRAINICLQVLCRYVFNSLG